MMPLLLYLAKISLVAIVTSALYVVHLRRSPRDGYAKLVAGLCCLLAVTLLTLFPLFQFSSVSDWFSVAREGQNAWNVNTSLTSEPLAHYWNLLVGVFTVLIVAKVLLLLGGYLSILRRVHQADEIDDSKLKSIVSYAVQNSKSIRPQWQRSRFYEVAGISSAATFGLFRPVVLLPTAWSSWSDEKLAAVVTHEIAHVVRRDFAFRFLSELIRAIHFYHPSVQWLADRIRTEQEHLADLAAAEVVGVQSYKKLLVKESLNSEQLRLLNIAPSFSPKTEPILFHRVQRLVADSRCSRGTTKFGGRVVMLLALLPTSIFLSGLTWASLPAAARSLDTTPSASELLGPEESDKASGSVSNFELRIANTEETGPKPKSGVVVDFSKKLIFGSDKNRTWTSSARDDGGLNINKTYEYRMGVPKDDQ